MMAAVVYILCAATAMACALLLLRGYKRSGVRLLLWSGLCFVFLAINNTLLFIDLSILPKEIDLSPYRNLTNLVALILLLYGLIWDSK